MANKIYPFANLIGGVDDSYLDYFDGNNLFDGDFAFGVDSNGIQRTYRLSASSGATESSPYVIAPDTNAGTKRWILMVPGGEISHVRAKGASTTIANAAYTQIINGTEVTDLLGEYDTTTGEFTAKHSGYYNICFAYQLSGASFSPGDFSLGKAVVNSTDVSKSNRWLCQTSGTYVVGRDIMAGTHYITAGQVLEIWAYQDSGSSIALTGDPFYNWLTIDRVL